MARKQRCVVEDEETERRCHRFGEGDPPLCNVHDAQRILSELMEYPEVEEGVRGVVDALDRVALGRVRGVLDRFAGLIDNIGQTRARATTNPPTNGHARPRPQTPPPPRPKGEDPRLVLMFDPQEQLTIVKVKERHRQLALLLHPDRQGSTTQMARLNNARDELLKLLR